VAPSRSSSPSSPQRVFVETAEPGVAAAAPASQTHWRPALAVAVAVVVVIAVARRADGPAMAPAPTVAATAPPPPVTKASELARLAATIRSRPGDVAARDALLARARLHADAGDWIRAREDLIRLLRRPDVDPIRADAEALQRRVEDGRRAALSTR